MSRLGTSLPQILAAFALALSAAAAPPLSATQQAKPEAKDAKPAPAEKNPAQIELLETKYRFETNGDSRKEVHTRVRINNELGARQFARLNFDFNRSFQSVEIPFVRVTHASGGTADILPSAITDNPNPAVVDYPAYHDVRVKSVRILGLQPDDLLEYRVITTTTHHPLAPYFWLDHTFDRSGVVSQEIFELDLPASRSPIIRINPVTAPKSKENSGVGEDVRLRYSWDQINANSMRSDAKNDEQPPDVLLSTEQWEMLSIRLDLLLRLGKNADLGLLNLHKTVDHAAHEIATPDILAKANELTATAQTDEEKLRKLYDFVSKEIKTIDLPLGSTEFVGRTPSAVLASSYATQEDKFVLFAGLARAAHLGAEAALTGFCDSKSPPRSTAFNHLLIRAASRDHKMIWLDPSLEVAPFGLIPANPGKCAFALNSGFFVMSSTGHEWESLDAKPPFAAKQLVNVRASLGSDGGLKATAKYNLRGDNELLLRVAFHKTDKEKWKDVAQMLALSDGFRGQIVNVTASDPYATKEPFTVEYEISQPKFVDWSKKTVRIPAILPLPGLPDPPTAEQIKSGKPIELGTALAIDLEATIELPAGATAQAPIGTAVNRDYATFTSKYSVQGNTLHASRSLHFISSELPASRATDLNAFLHAVQSDQTQLFTIQPAPQK